MKFLKEIVLCVVVAVPTACGNPVRTEGRRPDNRMIMFCGQMLSQDTIKIECFESSVKDLSPLQFFANLADLNLRDTNATNLEPIKGLSHLKRLSLWGTPVSDLRPLAGLVGLEKLSLWSTQVSNVEALKGLSGLRKLNLWNTQVTDLLPLHGMENLAEVLLYKRSYSVEEIQQLQSALPSLKVRYRTF